MRNRIVINVGDRFNFLTIIKELPIKTIPCGQKKRMFECACVCGKIIDVSISSLRHGNQISCGCKDIDKIGDATRTHGMASHRLYQVWKGIMTRCYNNNHNTYKHYGERGIVVCEDWHDVKNFINDMNDSFVEGLEIDRIDNNGNYCMENCKWSTRKEQMLNQRKTTKILWQDKYYLLEELANMYGIKKNTLRSRLFDYNIPLERALLKGNLRSIKAPTEADFKQIYGE